jgi:hypothetical protein
MWGLLSALSPALYSDAGNGLYETARLKDPDLGELVCAGSRINALGLGNDGARPNRSRPVAAS